MNYVNPQTGGPVMQTIGASMQMLRPGEKTARAPPHRLGDLSMRQGRGLFDHRRQRFDWKKRDIFCVPAWAFHDTATFRFRRRLPVLL